MSRWKHNDDTCEHCGLVYRDLRTGYTYADVRMLLWMATDDQTLWKYKRRRTVLGLWHQLKLTLWDAHLHDCESLTMLQEAEAKHEGELTELVTILREQLDEAPF